MVCFSEDCFWVKKHGDCFYDGLMPSNHPKTPEECEFFKTPTNADRIRSMTDEELARFLAAEAPILIHHFAMVKSAMMTQDKSVRTWLDWLRQEAE